MESLNRMIAIYMAGDKWDEMSPEQREFSQNMAQVLICTWALAIVTALFAIGFAVSLYFACEFYKEKVILEQRVQELQEQQPVIDNPVKIEDQSNE